MDGFSEWTARSNGFSENASMCFFARLLRNVCRSCTITVCGFLSVFTCMFLIGYLGLLAVIGAKLVQVRDLQMGGFSDSASGDRRFLHSDTSEEVLRDNSDGFRSSLDLVLDPEMSRIEENFSLMRESPHARIPSAKSENPFGRNVLEVLRSLDPRSSWDTTFIAYTFRAWNMLGQFDKTISKFEDYEENVGKLAGKILRSSGCVKEILIAYGEKMVSDDRLRDCHDFSHSRDDSKSQQNKHKFQIPIPTREEERNCERVLKLYAQYKELSSDLAGVSREADSERPDHCAGTDLMLYRVWAHLRFRNSIHFTNPDDENITRKRMKHWRSAVRLVQDFLVDMKLKTKSTKLQQGSRGCLVCKQKQCRPRTLFLVIMEMFNIVRVYPVISAKNRSCKEVASCEAKEVAIPKCEEQESSSIGNGTTHNTSNSSNHSDTLFRHVEESVILFQTKENMHVSLKEEVVTYMKEDSKDPTGIHMILLTNIFNYCILFNYFC